MFYGITSGAFRFPQMTTKEILQIVLPMGILTGDEVFDVLYHTLPSKKRENVKHRNLFPNTRRTMNKPVIVKVQNMPGNTDGNVSITDVVVKDDTSPQMKPPSVRFERVFDKGLRNIRVRFDCRLFLKRISIAGVPSRITTDGSIVTIRVIDTVLKELVSTFEFVLARAPDQPPMAASYKLDFEPIELCPKILYEITVSVDPPNPEIIHYRLPEVRDYNTLRFHYYKQQRYLDELYVDELHFTT